MKRFLAALMLLASTAQARTLVVGGSPGGSTPASAYLTTAAVTGVLNRIGGTYDVVPYTAATTDGIKAGKMYWGRHWKGSGGSTHSTNYDCVVVIWQADLYSSANGFFPDSLTLGAQWPSVPVIFLSLAASNASAWENQAGGTPDTTGIGVSLPFNSFRDLYRVEFNGVASEHWISQGTQLAVKAASPGPGVFRKILSAGVSNLTSADTRETCTACDYWAGDSTTARSDSLVMWVRYRTDLPNAPLIFAHWSATTGMLNTEIVAMCLAMADSASGGKVFDLVNKQGPAKVGLYVNGGVSTGNYASNVGGTFCRSDSCDSANVRNTILDLAALKVRVTVGADPDSMKTLSWLVNYWKLNPYVHFSMESHAGAITGGTVVSTNASFHRPYDPLGYLRTRVIYRPGATTFPWTCAENDTDQYCLLKGAYFLMDSLVPGLVDHGIVGYDEDWSNIGVTNLDASKLDTLGGILSAAGVKTLTTSPDRVISNVHLTDATVGTNAHGWDPSERRWDVGESPGGQTRGRSLYVLRSRGYTNISPAGGLTFIKIHNMSDEFMQGFFLGYWYPQSAGTVNNIFYKGESSPHLFHVPLEVMSAPMSTMGGAGQGTVSHRRGYYDIKWIANQVSVINKLAGRTLVEFDWLENIRPAP